MPGRILYLLTLAACLAAAAPRPRLIVLTDIGGDPDDRQSLIRLLTYANEFEIEGLIASASGTPGELDRQIVQPQLIREIVEAYGQVQPNLAKHDPRFPPAERLLERIKSGNPQRGAPNVGEGRDTAGSDWIIAVVDRDDPRPVNVSIWGGSTELAQALWRVRDNRGVEGLERFLAKLRVHAIAHQDDTGPWIVDNFPDLFYVLDKAPDGADKRESVFRGMYLGGDESLTSLDWLREHVLENHGPLGALYPTKTWTAPNPHSALKEGDTPSWFYFLPNGLGDPDHPDWGGWGGRFEHLRGGLWVDAADTVAEERHARATVWRWRPHYQRDFAARLDWCVDPPEEANHQPTAFLNGVAPPQVIEVIAEAGSTLELTAAGSADPDGDALDFTWFVYPEAGTYRGEVPLEPNGSRVRVQVPEDAAGETIHVILEAHDQGEPPLVAYRRAVVRVAR